MVLLAVLDEAGVALGTVHLHLTLTSRYADLLAAAGTGEHFVCLSAGKGIFPAVVLGHHLIVNDHVLHIFLISLIDISGEHTEIHQDQKDRGCPVDQSGLEKNPQNDQDDHQYHHRSGQLVHTVSSIHKTCNFLFQL